MNPFNWERRHQIALVLALIIGAAAGIILGYFVYAVPRGADGGLRFSYWVERPIRRGALYWALFGACIGIALIYVRRLTRR